MQYFVSLIEKTACDVQQFIQNVQGSSRFVKPVFSIRGLVKNSQNIFKNFLKINTDTTRFIHVGEALKRGKKKGGKL